MLARVPPLILLVVGFGMTLFLVTALRRPAGTDRPPVVGHLFLMLLAVAVTALADRRDDRSPAAAAAPSPRRGRAGLGRDPRRDGRHRRRRRTGAIGAGSRCCWSPRPRRGVALVGARRDDAADSGPIARTDGRCSGRSSSFAIAIVMASGPRSSWSTSSSGLCRAVDRRRDRSTVCPGSRRGGDRRPAASRSRSRRSGPRRAAGGTFYAQAAANRRNSILLLITLVGIVAATAEIIAVTLTFDPIPALWAAARRGIVGLGAAAGREPVRRARSSSRPRAPRRPTRSRDRRSSSTSSASCRSPRTSRCRASTSSPTGARTRSRRAAIRSTPRRGDARPARGDGPRGAPGRHRPRARPHPQPRHAVRALRRRPGRARRAGRRTASCGSSSRAGGTAPSTGRATTTERWPRRSPWACWSGCSC